MSTHLATVRQPWATQLRRYFLHGRHTRRAIAANRVRTRVHGGVALHG